MLILKYVDISTKNSTKDYMKENITPQFLQPQEGITVIQRETGNTQTEKVTAEKLMKFGHEKLLGRSIMKLIRLKLFSVLRGKWADLPASRKKLEKFVLSCGINKEEAEKALEKYPTRNALFTRKLKPEAREIVMDENTACIPADSAVWIQENVHPKTLLRIKNKNLSLSEILQNSELAEKYKEGTFVCCRLRPEDYHHWHSPVEGIPTEPKNINGKLNSVSPFSLRENIKVWGENKRAVYEILSPTFGKVQIIPIGAMFVGKMEHTFAPGKKVKKGQDIGKFYIGGSTVLVLFKKGIINISPDLKQNSKMGIETICKMGQPLGTCPQKENMPELS